jgi:D-aminoacyl-tRNA deacylase
VRALIQRVGPAAVRAGGEVVGAIDDGLLVLVGVGLGDGPDEARWLARKVATLRVFTGADGRMRHDVREHGGGVLVVSQFTLFGDLRKGNRPSFTAAAPPHAAEPLVGDVARLLREDGLTVAEGAFGAAMEIDALLAGPVTIWIDTAERGGSN